MEFVGRKTELDSFKNLYAKPTFALAMLYGRRRIGKTELVLQSLKESSLPHLYYQCRKTSEKDNALALSALAQQSLFPELPKTENIEELLRYFFLASKNKPFILLIDEYPYLKEKVAGLDSILQSLIQSYSQESSLKLVLLGSYIASMKESVGMGNAPLRGRADYVKDLTALDYEETAKLTPGRSSEEAFFFYALFGGVPYYLNAVDPKKSPEENLIALILKEDAFLANEADYILSEISGEDAAREVFQAIAQGNHAFGDILDHTSLKSSSSLSWSLHELEEMELIKREVPINEPSFRKAHYEISDPFLRFYYRFIYPHLSSLRLLSSEAFFNQFVKGDLYASFLPHAFESLCQSYLLLENRTGKLNPPLIELGRGVYHDKENHINGEFDVMAKQTNGNLYFECKYEKDPFSLGEIKHLEEQIRRCKLPYQSLGFFARASFTAEAKAYADKKGYFCRTLNEIYHQ